GSTGEVVSAGGFLTLNNVVVAFSSASGIYAPSPSRLTLIDSVVSNNASDGVYLADPFGLALLGNAFDNNGLCAVYLSFASTDLNPAIAGNTVSGNGTNGLDLSGT